MFREFSNADEKTILLLLVLKSQIPQITAPAVKARLLYGNWDFVDSNDAAAYWNFSGEKHLVDGLREKVYDPLKPLTFLAFYWIAFIILNESGTNPSDTWVGSSCHLWLFK